MTNFITVIRGLVPRTHTRWNGKLFTGGRDKPGHDGVKELRGLLGPYPAGSTWATAEWFSKIRRRMPGAARDSGLTLIFGEANAPLAE